MPCSNFVGTRQVQVSGTRVTLPECLELTHFSKAIGISMKFDLKINFTNIAKWVPRSAAYRHQSQQSRRIPVVGSLRVWRLHACR